MLYITLFLWKSGNFAQFVSTPFVKKIPYFKFFLLKLEMIIEKDSNMYEFKSIGSKKKGIEQIFSISNIYKNVEALM